MSLFPERRAPGAPNVAKCLGDAVEAGRLSREQAEEALSTVRRMMEEKKLPEDAAAVAAAKELKRAAEMRKRQAALQILATHRRLEDIQSHPKGMAAGVAAVFGRDLWQRARYSNVELRGRVITGELHAQFATGMNAFRSRMAGLSQGIASPRAFLRELFGENTGDALAGAAAREWTNTHESALRRFNQAGGDIRRNNTWRLPQEWDPTKVKAAGRQAFEDYMHKAVEEGRLSIVDWETGEAVNALRRAEIISQAFDNISTDGLNKFVPGQSAKPKLANARQERRAFEWQSGDAWLDFNDRFGVGDAGIYEMLVGHMAGMGRDIAQLELLGPNPGAMAQLLIDHAKKAGASGGQLARLQNIWDQVTGIASSPTNELAADIMRGTRSMLSAAQLGSAAVSSVTDFGTMKATASWNGLSTTRMMQNYVGALNPANEADRIKLVRLGLGAEGWATRAVGAMRNQMEIVGNDLPGRTADFVMRASGLSAHTQAGKWASGLEFLQTLADHAGRGFDALPRELKRAMESYGLTPQQWDMIRAAEMLDDGGVRALWPEKIAAQGRAEQQAATRMMEMVHNEMGFAILEPGALERAYMLGATRPGQFWGEVARSVAQYKSFPLTMMTRHLMRWMESIRAGDPGLYMVSSVISLTVMGAVALQAKQILQGKDPREPLDWRFWGAAFMQGGGAGILGDFLYAGMSRADRGFIGTMVGPTAGLIDDVTRLTLGSAGAIAEERDANFGANLARFVRRNAPGSTLWYTRLAVDRLMFDRLQELLDPDYRARFRRMEARARKETGQEYFWRPGQVLPDRMPGFGAGMD